MSNTKSVSITEAKKDLGNIVDEVRIHRSAIAVTRNRAQAAFIVDAVTYEHLRAIEDEWLAHRLRERLRTEKTRPLEDVIEDLGLDR